MNILFYGSPNSIAKVTTKYPYTLKKYTKPLFRFDENGEYLMESNDFSIINELKRKYRYSISADVEPIETETTADTCEEIKVKHCKKCDFTCTNQGDLLYHYRSFHAKEKGV